MSKPSKAEQYAYDLSMARNALTSSWQGKPDGLDGARATARITERGEFILTEGTSYRYDITLTAHEVRALLPWLHENFDLQESQE